MLAAADRRVHERTAVGDTSVDREKQREVVKTTDLACFCRVETGTIRCSSLFSSLPRD